jgi:hypothetical protein
MYRLYRRYIIGRDRDRFDGGLAQAEVDTAWRNDIGGKSKEKWARPNDEEDLGPVSISPSMLCTVYMSNIHLDSGGVPSTTEHNNNARKSTTSKSSASLCCAFAAGTSLLYIGSV